MNYFRIQLQYEKIHSFLKTTTEPYDFLEWDGNDLIVWLNNLVIEKYNLNELKKIIQPLNSDPVGQ